MSQGNADRNLLLGILAYQNALVTRDALFAGMQAWLYDKSKSLAEILQNQGALDAERRQLLEAMVGHHLKQHGGDAQRSLQAVSSAGSVRGDLEKMPDPDLQASLVHLAKAGDDDDPYRTRSTAGTPTSAGTRFRRLRPHAKGGLGEVFVALDSELNREVALKEIQDRHADEPESRSRFLQEAEITGGLEHPGIVPVYGLGTNADGRPFYAMRFIRGDSLMEAIAKYHKPPSAKPRGESSNPAGSERNLQLHKLVRRLIDVCNALQYAHDRGVLHRDLKPGNIMLGKYGETLVVDWGLAKASGKSAEPEASATGAIETPLHPASGSGSAETLPGSALGTPAFMSPEQAAGRLDLLGPASDIYSLGATLYCLLTGRPPFKGDVAEVLKKVQEGDFLRPRQIDTAITPPLEAVCLKAMALRPEDRYASPQQLAEDLEHWLADEPVGAYPEPILTRTGRWMRKHRTLVVSAVLLTVTIGSIAVATVLARLNRELDDRNAGLEQARGELDKANAGLVRVNGDLKQSGDETEKANAGLKKARDQIEDLLATSTMTLARSRFEEGDPALAESLLAQIPAKFQLAPWRLLKNYIQGSLFTLRGHTDVVRSVAFAADGQMLASASDDHTVKLWKARTGQEIRTLHGHMRAVLSVAFAAEGQVLASASFDKTVKLWDARTGQELHTLRGHTLEVTSVAFTPDGQVLASASVEGTVKLWDARTGQEIRTLRASGATSMAFAAKGEVLASASSVIKLWDARTGQELRTLRANGATRVAFAADGQVLASASSDSTVKLWDTRTGQDPEKERRFRAWVTSPDLHLHSLLAEQAEVVWQRFAFAFRLGRYLAAKSYYAAEPKEAATLAGWLGTAAQPPGLLSGLPALVKTPFHAPTFPDGIACTGVLYKDSGIAPARLLIGTSRALEGDPTNWLNHAFHGGALLRNGEHAKALTALQRAVELHGRPSPLTHNMLALVALEMGQKDKAKVYLKQAEPAKDAPWEDAALHRLLQVEVAAALAKAEGKPGAPEKSKAGGLPASNSRNQGGASHSTLK